VTGIRLKVEGNNPAGTAEPGGVRMDYLEWAA
jgi:hypothetical protein